MIKLYHGTNVEFGLLDPTLSRGGLDFGRGSYLTPDIEQAWGMARRKQIVLGGRRLVMEYDFDNDCFWTILPDASILKRIMKNGHHLFCKIETKFGTLNMIIPLCGDRLLMELCRL